MHDYVGWLIGGGIACLLCLWSNLRGLRRRRLLADTPTSKTLGVFIGMTELKGTAEAAEPLTSFLAALPNVHYQWKVEESWSRMVTETNTDKDGKSHTRTRRESGWTTVADGCESIPFYLQDDTGVILVRPPGRWDAAIRFIMARGRRMRWRIPTVAGVLSRRAFSCMHRFT
jgi:hypothetical protein